MEMRVFGRTGLQLSVLGFGCGAVGGLMVRGDPRDQERTIARAIASGVNYFDTAVQYGNGESEKNLGRVLQKLKPANVVVGTKVRLPSGDFGRIADAVAKSLEGSLARLRLDRVDIFHLHNAVSETGGGEALSVRRCSVRWYQRSIGCASKARHIFLGLPASATRRRCIR
jgi:aryl-alcohol dehydrogenase-like predicted oxidoreductase